jgi:uncharacterized protein with ParB-like and HNH nuclease domain
MALAEIKNMNMKIIKKIQLFRVYIKRVALIVDALKSKFNIRVDNAYRMYTVLNIPSELIGESYSLKKSDIDRISENYIREFSRELSIFLNKNDLNELYTFYKIEKVDKFSYLIVIGFSLFKSNKFYDMIYFKIIPILITLGLVAAIYLTKF